MRLYYTGPGPSGISINDVELVEGDSVDKPQSLMKTLQTRPGWSTEPANKTTAALGGSDEQGVPTSDLRQQSDHETQSDEEK